MYYLTQLEICITGSGLDNQPFVSALNWTHTHSVPRQKRKKYLLRGMTVTPTARTYCPRRSSHDFPMWSPRVRLRQVKPRAVATNVEARPKEYRRRSHEHFTNPQNPSQNQRRQDAGVRSILQILPKWVTFNFHHQVGGDQCTSQRGKRHTELNTTNHDSSDSIIILDPDMISLL